MALGYVSDSIATTWLTTLRNNARWASVHFETPNWIDPNASEAFNDGYIRQPVFWTTESARGIRSSNLLVFPALNPMTVAAIGLWNNYAGGTMAAYCTAPPGSTAAYLAVTSTLSIPIGELAVRI